MGYAAAVSYSDYNVGVLLDKLDALDLTASTLVTVIGDHGWHLGDKDTWAKMTAWEDGVRIPMIIRCPWKTSAIGKVTSVLAEAVDLYPTIVALVGLASPLSQGEELNGTNLEPAEPLPNRRPSSAGWARAQHHEYHGLLDPDGWMAVHLLVQVQQRDDRSDHHGRCDPWPRAVRP